MLEFKQIATDVDAGSKAIEAMSKGGDFSARDNLSVSHRAPKCSAIRGARSLSSLFAPIHQMNELAIRKPTSTQVLVPQEHLKAITRPESSLRIGWQGLARSLHQTQNSHVHKRVWPSATESTHQLQTRTFLLTAGTLEIANAAADDQLVRSQLRVMRRPQPHALVAINCLATS